VIDVVAGVVAGVVGVVRVAQSDRQPRQLTPRTPVEVGPGLVRLRPVVGEFVLVTGDAEHPGQAGVEGGDVGDVPVR
jgi:hypothetical protein